MMSIANYSETAKKLVINRLPVPMDVLSVVKDYLFHNENTSPMIKNIQGKKIQICELINTATTNDNWLSRDRNHAYHDMNPNIPGEWLFVINIPMLSLPGDDYWPLSIIYEFGAKNCNICGEYKQNCNRTYYHHISYGLSDQNVCKCVCVKNQKIKNKQKQIKTNKNKKTKNKKQKTKNQKIKKSKNQKIKKSKKFFCAPSGRA